MGEDGWFMRQDTENLIKELKPPGVEVFCIYGAGLPTADKFRYSKYTWHDGQPETIYTDGDGIVSARSAKGCVRWMKTNEKPVHYQIFDRHHLLMLDAPKFLDYLQNEIIDKINEKN